jgi:hypothetical protein
VGEDRERFGLPVFALETVEDSLLADGVRVLTREMKKLQARFGQGGDRGSGSDPGHGQAGVPAGAAAAVEQKKAKLHQLYREALRITTAVVGEAKRAVAAVRGRLSRASAAVVSTIEKTIELVHHVQAQTRARVFKGDTHYRDKVLSLFERATEAIRKGKSSKPTEFGKLAKIQEADGQFITDYAVCATRMPDLKLWEPSLKRHEELFGRAPRLATADASFFSTANVKLANERGAGMGRCRYRGMAGMERCVGFAVIANDLWVLGSAPA